MVGMVVRSENFESESLCVLVNRYQLLEDPRIKEHVIVGQVEIIASSPKYLTALDDIVSCCSSTDGVVQVNGRILVLIFPVLQALIHDCIICSIVANG